MKAILVLVVAGAIAGAACVWFGVYDVSATNQHLAPTYHLLKKAMERSVEVRARDVAVPPLGAPEQVARGVALYRGLCSQCHGAPGVAPDSFALGLTPLPTPLQRSGRDRTPAELFWVVKHGIKMTGMPAWEFRLGDEDIWALVAFMKRMPLLSPAEYASLSGSEAASPAPIPAAATPDLARGQRALKQYGCVGCHEIPHQVGPEARLGPTLHGIGSRSIIGGVLPNSPDNMARWLQDPQAFATRTAMPNLGVTERDARDMAAYLATLR